MVVDLNTLLAGKATKIKGKDYFPTAAYVEPFLERVQKYTNDFRVQVKLPDQITSIDNEDNITYNRVAIEAILPDDYAIEGHKRVLGMVYGLDTRKPVVKHFVAAERCVCTNLCIFSPDMLEIQELQPETAINFKPLNRLIDTADTVAKTLKALTSMEVSYTSETVINEDLGKWVRNCMDCCYDTGFGKVKLATSAAIDAYKLLFVDEDSEYLVNKTTSMFNVYNAFTQVITDNLKKDFINTAEKTLLLKDILGLDIK